MKERALEWLHWLKDIQHEWWFIPSSLLILLAGVAIIWGVKLGVRIVSTRFMGWLTAPKMKETKSQVDAEWATAEDLEAWGLVSPQQKATRKWR